jgi:hypothetical protein
LICKLPEEKTYEYVIDYNKVISIKTSIIPIIIDYGKSHVIHKGKHYGFINMFKASTVHDIMTILLSSVNQIIKTVELNRKDEAGLMNLMAFISLTRFCPKPFITFPAMRFFVSENSSFSNLICANFYELEERTPMHLYDYIEGLKACKNSTVSDKRFTEKHTYSAMTQFKYILTVQIKPHHPIIPNIKDKVFIYYFFQNINDIVYKNKFKNMLKYSTLKDIKIQDSYPYMNISDEHYLSHPKKYTQPSSDNYCDTKEMLDSIMTYRGEFEVSEDDRKLITEKYSNLSNSHIVRRYFADN